MKPNHGPNTHVFFFAFFFFISSKSEVTKLTKHVTDLSHRHSVIHPAAPQTNCKYKNLPLLCQRWYRVNLRILIRQYIIHVDIQHTEIKTSAFNPSLAKHAEICCTADWEQWAVMSGADVGVKCLAQGQIGQIFLYQSVESNKPTFAPKRLLQPSWP